MHRLTMLHTSITPFASVARLSIRRPHALSRAIVGMLCGFLILLPLNVGEDNVSLATSTPVATPMPMGVWQPIAMPNDDQYYLADFSAADG